MKKILLITLLFLMALSATAGTVRGLLTRGNYPAAAIAVTISSPNTGRSSPSVTGHDGMYYLFNVPPGYYTLEVWAYGVNQPPMTFNITVYNQPYTDIPPVRVP